MTSRAHAGVTKTLVHNRIASTIPRRDARGRCSTSAQLGHPLGLVKRPARPTTSSPALARGAISPTEPSQQKGDHPEAPAPAESHKATSMGCSLPISMSRLVVLCGSYACHVPSSRLC
jgi:hypothetical protein